MAFTDRPEKLKKAREYEEKYARFISDEERPAYHLTPRIGWMNDPNGFSFYNGAYHLFYQYHPYSLEWGPMHWGHAVSRDLLHWEYLPCALAPDQDYDGFGCFSGSASELPDGRQLLMYTGVREEMCEDGRQKTVQTQCMAVGDGLNYEKYEVNPVLDETSLPAGGSRLDFRDPKLWREEDGSFACIVGNRTEDGSGSLLLYRSEDGFHWNFETIVDRSYNEFGKMWECPDMFELDGKTVILTSPQEMSQSGLEFHNGNGTMYLIGQYDREKKHFERENLGAIDYGIDFYAPQTVQAPDGRRIMIGWMQNWDACVAPSGRSRWIGQMTIPRELRIVDGKLLQMPIREIETLRGHRVYHRMSLCNENTLQGIFGRRIDLTVTLTPSEEESYERFRIRLARGSRHYTMISYNPKTSVLKIDRNNSGCCRDVVHERRCFVRQQRGKLKLRILLDQYSVEVFVNDGEQALTTAIYTPMSADGISFEVDGRVELEVEKYELRS
ncbi:MAG: glycoside hydrolase family 32 protein [Lachnospiraceae bacterium]|nr:glycoside hydrolase family 32 protein [Lachnospiraceae bacterium]